MAQNRNGSEPFVACGEKGQKGMWGMELWGKSDWVCGRKVSLEKQCGDDTDCQLEYYCVIMENIQKRN